MPMASSASRATTVSNASTMAQASVTGPVTRRTLWRPAPAALLVLRGDAVILGGNAVTRLTIDRHIADPKEWWQFVALVVLAFAAERAAAKEVAPRSAAPATVAPLSIGRRRRDIRPPRAC
jgi:hypothetical protein